MILQASVPSGWLWVGSWVDSLLVSLPLSGSQLQSSCAIQGDSDITVGKEEFDAARGTTVGALFRGALLFETRINGSLVAKQLQACTSFGVQTCRTLDEGLRKLGQPLVAEGGPSAGNVQSMMRLAHTPPVRYVEHCGRLRRHGPLRCLYEIPHDSDSLPSNDEPIFDTRVLGHVTSRLC